MPRKPSTHAGIHTHTQNHSFWFIKNATNEQESDEPFTNSVT